MADIGRVHTISSELTGSTLDGEREREREREREKRLSPSSVHSGSQPSTLSGGSLSAKSGSLGGSWQGTREPLSSSCGSRGPIRLGTSVLLLCSAVPTTTGTINCSAVGR